jgi:RNA polymerase sigma factor (sigma-70 family)
MPKDHRAFFNNLISRCKEGDDKAWHELIDLVGPVIFSHCRKSRLSRDESFDIFGRVSYQLVNSINSLKSPEKILSFVITITRRQIYNFYQNLKIVDFYGEQTLDSIPDDVGVSPDKLYETTRIRQVLMEAMSHLSDRDNKLVKMLFFDPNEPSYKEISEKLKMPVSSIGPIRAKILARLYQVLKKKSGNLGIFRPAKQDQVSG